MRKNIFIGSAIFILVVGLYLVKCFSGIDILKGFSLGIYKNDHTATDITRSTAFAEDSGNVQKNQVNRIIVDFGNEKGRVNRKIFGNNFLGHEGLKSSDYGYGLWDGKWDKAPIRTVGDLAKDIGMTMARFPGGCGSHAYDWKKAVGKDRKEFRFGINEFIETADQIGAETVFTVSYFTGDETDAADLVEYLNAVNDGLNPNNGIDWAAQRAKDGHEEPYGIKYFEIGNEVWHGDHQEIKEVSPQEYAQRYLKYYTEMKRVDSSIQIGAILRSPQWNVAVLDIIQNKIDFGIVHLYPTPVWGKKLETMEPKYIFETSLAIPVVKYGHDIEATLRLLREKAGRDIPLAITEFNGGFTQDKPVPYRHTMGNALVNAELLRAFMEPKNNILMANHWNFVNEYWGMISNGFNGKYETLNKPYYKRPNYYTFEMYHDHFGDVLVETGVQSDFYDAAEHPSFFKSLINRLKVGEAEGRNLIDGEWKISDFPGVTASQEGVILSLEFKAPEKFNYYHSVKRVAITPDTYYRLSGYIKTDGLVDKDKNGICLEVQDGRGWARTHSAISTQKIKGTTDWQYVEAIYKTLSDANSVTIIARRIGETGPLKGKAYFKDVKFEKFTPELDTRIPYLTVNASKNEDGNKVYLMVVNKNLEEPMATTIELKDFVPANTGDAWVLNGPAVDATNEKDHENVKITHNEFDIGGNSFEFTFEPHSLTAIEISRHESIK